MNKITKILIVSGLFVLILMSWVLQGRDPGYLSKAVFTASSNTTNAQQKQVQDIDSLSSRRSSDSVSAGSSTTTFPVTFSPVQAFGVDSASRSSLTSGFTPSSSRRSSDSSTFQNEVLEEWQGIIADEQIQDDIMYALQKDVAAVNSEIDRIQRAKQSSLKENRDLIAVLRLKVTDKFEKIRKKLKLLQDLNMQVTQDFLAVGERLKDQFKRPDVLDEARERQLAPYNHLFTPEEAKAAREKSLKEQKSEIMRRHEALASNSITINNTLFKAGLFLNRLESIMREMRDL